MDITKQILHKLELLRKKPKMVIPITTIDYTILKVFIIGYIDGIGSMVDKDLIKEITSWLNMKINQQYSVSWVDIVPAYYRDKTDKQLQEILLDLNEDYFDQKPDWYKNK